MESARDVRNYLIDVVGPHLFGADGALTTHSTPDPNLPNDVVSVGAQRFEVSKPTMGTNRSREEVVETDVMFSCYRPGDEKAQRIATTQAFTMALALDEWFRTKPNEELGGACREAWVSGGELDESKVVPAEGGTAVQGRMATLVVTVTTRARR